MEDKNLFEVLRPFGPTIMEIDMPEEVVNNVNNYVEKIIKDKEKSRELDAGGQLVGQVTQEISLEKDFYESHFKDFLFKAVETYIFGSSRKKIKNFKLRDCWVVRQYENEYNPNHYHSGHLSGVGYLKVPKNLGSIPNKTKNPNGKLELIHGSKQFLSSSTFSITPKVGDFYLFPNYMMHTVYPFTDTDEERRSVSFNAIIDEEIFNVFNQKK